MEEETPDVEKAYDLIHFISCQFNADIKAVTVVVAEDVFRIVYKLSNDKRIKDLQCKK